MKRFTVTASVLALFGAAALFAKSEAQTRTVYFSAVDKKGAPVADLKAADVQVTEEGPQGPQDHDPVIDASTEASGGRVDPVLTDSGIEAALQRIADDLLGQYAVTYNSSPVANDGVRLRVEVKRAGVTVHAPERVGVR